MTSRSLLSALLMAACLAPASALAQSSDQVNHVAEYQACLSLTRLAPEDAFESALAWETAGGGDPARHCAAVALVYLEQYEEAAMRLEALANSVVARKPALAAEALGQAGQAWTMADQSDRALGAQTAALKLDPKNVELLIDRAITRAGREEFWEAVDDLNQAADFEPDRADVLIFRASAYRMLDAPGLAKDDLTRALSIDPNNPEGLLERGILRHDAGNKDGARADYLRVLQLVPAGPVAESARRRLEKLDVKVEE